MFDLRPYQEDLMNGARKHLANGVKGVLIQSPPGSGKSVVIAEITRLASQKNGYVLFLAHRRELLDNIKETFEDNEVNLKNVMVESVMKARNNLETMPKPTLIITDEGHHSKATTYKTIYEHYSDVPRLGFTATPYRMNGEGFTDIYEKMVVGPSIKWLIENKCLAPYRWYSIPLIDRSKVDFKSTKKTDESTTVLFESDATIQGDIVKNYLKYASGQQAIVYAPTISISKKIVEWFNEAGIHAVHADAKTKSKERDEIMQKFKNNEITVLSNVDLISEGFNVPDVGVIILCRPTQSVVLHLQQSMRGMRYKEGKQSIILDHVGNGSNLGLPEDDYEWSLESRKRKSDGAAPEPPKMTCTTCGQQFLLKSMLKIDERPHCPFCMSEIKIEERKDSVTFDEMVEMVELTQETTKFTRLSNKKMLPSKKLAYNYDIAKAKTIVEGKGNPLYKLFGSMVAYRGKKYDEEQLTELADEKNLSLSQVEKAYQWARVKHEEKPEKPKWFQNTLY